MGLFDGYENVRPMGERSSAAPQGDHEVTVTRIEAPAGLRIGEAYIVHYRIDQTTSPECQPGAEYSFFQAGFSGHRNQQEAARGAVLSCMLALAGAKPDTNEAAQVQAQIGAIMRASASAQNPFAGLRMHIKTTLVPPREPGKSPFLRTAFYAIPGCEPQLQTMLHAAQALGNAPPAPRFIPQPAAAPAPQYAPPAAPAQQYAPQPPVAAPQAPAGWPAPPPGYVPGPAPTTPPAGLPPPPAGWAYGAGGQLVKI